MDAKTASHRYLIITALAGFLFFWIQPLIGKILLPMLGGAPSIWTVSLFFFQMMLLGGYSYVFLIKKFTIEKQLKLHRQLLIASVLCLPLMHLLNITSMANPEIRLMINLILYVGFPLFILAATSPLLQLWYAQETLKESYFLYAVSNFACIVALVGFIVILEPFVTTKQQLLIWNLGFVFYVIYFITYMSKLQTVQNVIPGGEQSSYVIWTRWIFLSFLVNSLLYGFSFLLTNEMAAVPLLWVVPLVLFLFCFVISFNYPKVQLKYFDWLLIIGAIYSLIFNFNHLFGVSIILFNILLFGMVSFRLTNIIYAYRPPTARLPNFYLGLAIGGFLAGIFHTLLVPQLLHSVIEYPIILILAMFIILRGWFKKTIWCAVLVAMFLFIDGYYKINEDQAVVYQDRNFFGSTRIIDHEQPTVKLLMHGTTVHGAEFPDQSIATYYRDLANIFALLRRKDNIKVIIAGLGTGTMACYAEQDDEFTFIEIDPIVINVAQKYFSYLQRCPAKGGIIQNDARKGIEQLPDNNYDVIVIDVYHSDSIPSHLMTNEAMALFQSKLTSDGLILFHVSNRYFELRPIFARLAHEQDLSLAELVQAPETIDYLSLNYRSIWLALQKQYPGVAGQLSNWQRISSTDQGPLWTDAYSSILHPLFGQLLDDTR